jgi:hypothetical protein
VTLSTVSFIDVHIVNDAIDDAIFLLDLYDIAQSSHANASGLEHETIRLWSPEPWLKITTSDEPAQISVNEDGIDLDADGSANVEVTDVVTGSFTPFPVHSIPILDITSGAGNDAINVHHPHVVGALVYAGGGNDYVLGTDRGDRLNGGAGNDFVEGSGGGDLLYGETGDDWLYGGDGNDHIVGGTGYDHIYGGNAFDECQQDGVDYLQDCESPI